MVKAPSPDRLLNRLKDISEPIQYFQERRSTIKNEFSMNQRLNALNLKLLKKMGTLPQKEQVLDYDNTFIFTDKSDAKYTYLKRKGYCPGLGIIGNQIVYVENRNGNCAPHTLQDKTIERFFEQLKAEKIKVDSFRADSVSYQFEVINTVNRYVDKFYIRANMRSNIYSEINKIKNWQTVPNENNKYRASCHFTPFISIAQKAKRKDLLQQYRLVITKEPRKDG